MSTWQTGRPSTACQMMVPDVGNVNQLWPNEKDKGKKCKLCSAVSDLD